MTRTPQLTPVVGAEIFDLRPDYSAISVVAVLERLEPMPLAAAIEAAFALMETLRQVSPAAALTARLIDRIGTAEIS